MPGSGMVKLQIVIPAPRLPIIGFVEAVMVEFLRSFSLLVLGFSVTAAGILVIFYG